MRRNVLPVDVGHPSESLPFQGSGGIACIAQPVGWSGSSSSLPSVSRCDVAFAASPEAVRGQHGMVASRSALASQVGADIMRNGGNAIDAAVATGFALAVTYPDAGNLGGGGFMVIRLADGRVVTNDHRERAPAERSATCISTRAGNVVAGLSTQIASRGRRAGQRCRNARRAREIRHAAAQNRHGAGDSPCERRLRAERRSRTTIRRSGSSSSRNIPAARACS